MTRFTNSPTLKKCLVATLIAFSVASIGAQDVSIDDLAWMTGNWVGTFGDGNMEIEEIWNEPKAGSIQALVRLRYGERMMMVELIVIDEFEGSLRLRLQQWGPGMEPTDAGRQSMKLVNQTDREVSFEAEGDGPITKLTYRRPTECSFEIEVEQQNQPTSTLQMKAKGECVEE